METILVHETDAATLEVLTVALQAEGHRVRTTTDHDENILDLIRRYHPKPVLLDCGLSDHFARQISQWIKSHFPKLPLIAFSGEITFEQDYRKFGFDGYLKKPFDLDALYRIVRKYLTAGRRKRKKMARKRSAV